MAQIRSKQIQDFLTTVNWGTVTDKQIANASAIDARFGLAENSIDSLESLVAAGTGDLVDSVDSLELALSAEIVARGLDVDAEESRALVAEGSLDTKVSTETSRAMSVEVVLSNEIVNTYTTLDMAIDSKVSVETSRAIAAEGSLDTKVSVETSRAILAEGSLDTKVSTETSRAIAAEGSLDTKIGTVSTELVNEIDSIDTRLGQVGGDLVDSVDSLELALSAEISATNADFSSIDTRATNIEGSVSTETSRAIAAEGSLETSINTEKGRIDTILAGSAADLDQFAEVINYLNSVDAVNDLDLVNFMADANGNFTALDASVDSLENALTAEISSTNSDVDLINSHIDVISGSIDSLEGDITSIDSRLGQVGSTLVDSVDSLELALSAEIVARGLDVDAEESRALVAEGSLDTKISNTATSIEGVISAEISDMVVYVDNIEGQLSGALSQEIVDRAAGDLALDNRVDSLNTVVTNNYNTLDGLVSDEETRAMAAEAALGDSVDSLEVALAAEISATNADVDGINASIDSLEALTGADITALENSVDSLELLLSVEIYDARQYTSDEMLRAQIEEAALAASIDSLEALTGADITALENSVDSLEAAISAAISAEHVEHASVEAVLSAEIFTEKGRIDAILLAADADKDTFAEIVSLINAVDTTNDNAFASYALATDASIDSIELALSAEIAATNDDVTAINSSIDSLELALSAEIVATNDDIAAINDSIDSLETALADATTYVEQVVTGVTSGKTFSITTPVLFAADKDLEVFVNGLKVPFTTGNGISFTIVADYDLEGTDKVTVLGVVA